MRIGIIGAGKIGATLAKKLSDKGRVIKLANSKGPHSLHDLARKVGATAVAAEDAVKDVDVIILSVPFSSFPSLSPLFQNVPTDVTVIDTSNYYPFRDGVIAEVARGKPESVWVSEKVNRPVIKAWNAALAETLANRGRPADDPMRIALPVAGDNAAAKETAMKLIEETGFDAVDAGTLVTSWRQQPGTPAYCTELNASDLVRALDKADPSRAPHNREAIINGIMGVGAALIHDDVVARNRAGTT